MKLMVILFLLLVSCDDWFDDIDIDISKAFELPLPSPSNLINHKPDNLANIISLAKQRLIPNKPKQSIKNLNIFYSKTIEDIHPNLHGLSGILTYLFVNQSVRNKVTEHIFKYNKTLTRSKKVTNYIDSQLKVFAFEEINEAVSFILKYQIGFEYKKQLDAQLRTYFEDKILWSRFWTIERGVYPNWQFPLNENSKEFTQTLQLAVHFHIIVNYLSFLLDIRKIGTQLDGIQSILKRNTLTRTIESAVLDHINIPENYQKGRNRRQVNQFLELLRIAKETPTLENLEIEVGKANK